ncbi:HAD family hydrolase [Phenylobacterium conjunctum]|uniref:HAD family hydrolase n=1 Tax=Phenylobacterium conjunctum TaxID=1298959 RepID=A0ABW3T6A4_9CAUL
MVDVDGVVVRHPAGRRWDRDMQADLGLDPGLLQQRFFAAHFQDVVTGRADLHDRLAPVLAEIAPHLTSQALADYWFAQDAHLDLALLDDLARLRASGARLHLATVQEHHRARYLWETLGLKDRFDAIHYAADYGVGKPDPAFFRAVEQRTGLPASDLLLIDDSARNVESARACGWSAVLWDGTQTLSEVLGGQRHPNPSSYFE